MISSPPPRRPIGPLRAAKHPYYYHLRSPSEHFDRADVLNIHLPAEGLGAFRNLPTQGNGQITNQSGVCDSTSERCALLYPRGGRYDAVTHRTVGKGMGICKWELS